MQASRGEYVFIAGDDDYFCDGALHVLLDTIRKNRGDALFYMAQNPTPMHVHRGAGALGYIARLNYAMTWLTAVVMRRDLYLGIEEPQKYDDTRMPQVYLQLEMLKQKAEFTIIEGHFCRWNGESRTCRLQFRRGIHQELPRHLDGMCRYSA